MSKGFNSCVVLDIDETLIHTELSTEPNATLKKNSDFSFKMGDVYHYVKRRPHLETFINEVFKKFDHVCIWTAAEKRYAAKIVSNILTPEQQDDLLIFYSRKNCVIDNEGNYTKPLKKLFKQFDFLNKDNTVLIDNASHITRLNTESSININDFIDNTRDMELKKLTPKNPIISIRTMNNYKNKLSKKK